MKVKDLIEILKRADPEGSIVCMPMLGDFNRVAIIHGGVIFSSADEKELIQAEK